ncbi:MAG: hypothetical protein HRU19_21820 [Pseudobacteriovorax sp.]|nr:hypothetical protein [Pseudobacteriovorax sp.]
MLIVSGGVTVALVLLLKKSAFDQLQESTRYISASHKQTYRQEINRRQEVLGDVERLFSASGSVEIDEFQEFVQHYIDSHSLHSICWTSSNGEGFYTVGFDYCGYFDYLEPNKLLDAEQGRMILSKFVRSRNGQKGFASVIFDVEDLTTPVSEGYLPNEYIGILDSDLRKVKAYSIMPDGLMPVEGSLDLSDSNTEFSNLIRFGGIRIDHFIKWSTSFLAVDLSFMQVIVCTLVFVVVSLLHAVITFLRRKNQVIENHVQLRTAELVESLEKLTEARK